jgi:hypothetical protein
MAMEDMDIQVLKTAELLDQMISGVANTSRNSVLIDRIWGHQG